MSAKATVIKSCKNCEHWYSHLPRHAAHTALCRALPPSLTMTGESKFPLTNAGTCCGAWSEAEKEMTPTMDQLVTETVPVSPMVTETPALVEVAKHDIVAEAIKSQATGQVFGNSPKPEVPLLPSSPAPEPKQKPLPPMTVGQAKRFYSRPKS